MTTTVFVYQNGRQIDEITLVPHLLKRYLELDDCFFWVWMPQPDLMELARLGELFNLHELATEDVVHGDQRAKIEEYGPHLLFCVLRLISEQSLREEESYQLDFFVGRHYLISVGHSAEMLNISTIRHYFEEDDELKNHGPLFLFYLILDTFVDQYLRVIQRMEDELEDFENQLFLEKDHARVNIEKLYAFKHRLMVASHAISPLPEAIVRLNNTRLLRLNLPLQAYFRDVNDHILRLTRSLENMREMLVIALQVNLALIALEDSNVNKKLSGYAALFAVPTMIAGVYGMNFQHMPELSWPWAYPIVIFAMVLADVLIYWRLRSLKWL